MPETGLLQRDLVQPAHLWVPEHLGTYGDEAGEIMEMVGRPLDPEQQLAVDAKLAYGPGGRAVALETGLVMPRQNGKSSAVELAVVLYDLLVADPDRVVWTAHKVQTAMDVYTDIVTMCEQVPDLDRRVLKINRTGQDKSVVFRHPLYPRRRGAELAILARVGGSGRGLGGKRVVLDEALELVPAFMQALMPVLSARPDPQVDYVSSACLRKSTVLRGVRDRGRAGGDRSLVWVEWKAAGSLADPTCELGRRCTHEVGQPGCTFDDMGAVAGANPALDRRITRRYIEGERLAFSATVELRTAWAVERLGWDDDPVDDAGVGLSLEAWRRREDSRSQPGEGRGVAVAWDVAPGLTSASVALASWRDDGDVHLELIKYGRGTSWLAGYLDGEDGKSGLIDRLGLDEVFHMPTEHNDAVLARFDEDLQDVCTPLTRGEVASACVRFEAAIDPETAPLQLDDDVEDERPEVGLRHLGDELMQAAVQALVKRPRTDGGWTPSRAASTAADISPVCAGITAVHALVTGDELLDPEAMSL